MTNRKRGQLDELCMDRYTDAHLLPIWPDFNMGYINIETMEGLTE